MESRSDDGPSTMDLCLELRHEIVLVLLLLFLLPLFLADFLVLTLKPQVVSVDDVHGRSVS